MFNNCLSNVSLESLLGFAYLAGFKMPPLVGKMLELANAAKAKESLPDTKVIEMVEKLKQAHARDMQTVGDSPAAVCPACGFSFSSGASMLDTDVARGTAKLEVLDQIIEDLRT